MLRPGGKHHLNALSSKISQSIQGPFAHTRSDKIMGTEGTWLREGRRNNIGFPVPFSVTKKISFEVTIFKVKKKKLRLQDVIFTFFFLRQNKSHACFGHL